MTTEPLDPDKIMAEHAPHCLPWDECETHRLAAEVKRLQAVETRVKAQTPLPLAVAPLIDALEAAEAERDRLAAEVKTLRAAEQRVRDYAGPVGDLCSCEHCETKRGVLAALDGAE